MTRINSNKIPLSQAPESIWSPARRERLLQAAISKYATESGLSEVEATQRFKAMGLMPHENSITTIDRIREAQGL